MKSLRLLLPLLFLLGCAQGPTKIYETESPESLYLKNTLSRPILIEEDTLIIDARPAFDYALAHVPGAISVQWTDFTDPRGPRPGLLKVDLYPEIRRLASMGISPGSKIVVVGKGKKGNGEEARLAWTLLYLGIKNVQVAELDSLGLRFSNLQPAPRPSHDVWKLKLVTAYLADRKEIIKVATRPQSQNMHIIDVRSKDEYFSKSKRLEYEVPDLRAVNIEWKEFFTLQGRPNSAMITQLQAININLDDRIIVISNNGLRSGAVTYTLLALGFKNAANYAGGYTDLIR